MKKNKADQNFSNDVLQNAVQKAIAKAIMKCVKSDTKKPDSGGCRAFYSPAEWAERGEKYGKESFLVVVHDGGDLAPYFSLDYQQYEQYNKMEETLKEIGFYQEQCTSWYSAIYPKL